MRSMISTCLAFLFDSFGKATSLFGRFDGVTCLAGHFGDGSFLSLGGDGASRADLPIDDTLLPELCGSLNSLRCPSGGLASWLSSFRRSAKVVAGAGVEPLPKYLL